MQGNTLLVQYNTGSKHKNGIYIQIFLMETVVGILITQAQKLMIASSSLNEDTSD